jgi:thiosulfate dehydrogenase [quinone] large subunit
MSAMAWVRVLIGAVWLNGAVEKFLNPQFSQQLASSLDAGGFVAQAPPPFRGLMQSYVVPNAETVAQLARAGELVLAILLLLGLLTNLGSLGSIFLSLAIFVSEGGPRLGTGLGAPEALDFNLLIALLSLVVLLSPGAKAASLDARLARNRPTLAPLLLNRTTRRGHT